MFTSNEANYVVVSPFRDVFNPSRIYQPGERVPAWFGQDRISSLMTRGLIISDLPMGIVGNNNNLPYGGYAPSGARTRPT